jgi:hypothetical protein
VKPLLRSNKLTLTLKPAESTIWGRGPKLCDTHATPTENARPASEGTNDHPRRRRPRQADRLQLRSLFSSGDFQAVCNHAPHPPPHNSSGCSSFFNVGRNNINQHFSLGKWAVSGGQRRGLIWQECSSFFNIRRNNICPAPSKSDPTGCTLFWMLFRTVCGSHRKM